MARSLASIRPSFYVHSSSSSAYPLLWVRRTVTPVSEHEGLWFTHWKIKPCKTVRGRRGWKSQLMLVHSWIVMNERNGLF